MGKVGELLHKVSTLADAGDIEGLKKLGVDDPEWVVQNGGFEVVSPTYMVNNRQYSQWMYLLTGNEDIAEDYKSYFDMESGGYLDEQVKEEMIRDYIEYEIKDAENYGKIKVPATQLYRWAKEKGVEVKGKQYDEVLKEYIQSLTDEELKELVTDKVYDSIIEDWLWMTHSDLEANWGEIGEGDLDAYGGRGMPDTVDKENNFLGLNTGEVYVKYQNEYVSKIYCDIESL